MNYKVEVNQYFTLATNYSKSRDLVYKKSTCI